VWWPYGSAPAFNLKKKFDSSTSIFQFWDKDLRQKVKSSPAQMATFAAPGLKDQILPKC
jgi:hypothetical protein